MEIIRKADPETLEDIERSFRPIECRERDVTGLEAQLLGLPVRPTGNYRVFIVYAVCKDDANKLRHIAKVLGPATGGMMLSIPCGLEVEWAWIQEAMEYRAARFQERLAVQAERRAEWQKAIDASLVNIAEDMEKQKIGASTFGFGGHIQRSA